MRRDHRQTNTMRYRVKRFYALRYYICNYGY
jgi:hypothetical protein